MTKKLTTKEKEEFNLSKEIKDWEKRNPYWETEEYGLTALSQLSVILKRFIKLLKKASENNDWEVAVDDGEKDGFIVVSGVEFIDKLSGEGFK